MGNTLLASRESKTKTVPGNAPLFYNPNTLTVTYNIKDYNELPPKFF